MTATDERCVESDYPHTLRPELHRALDAAGIDYWVAQGITFWNRDDGCECLAYGFKADGVPMLAIKVVGFTDPEQAIAATLGRKPWVNPAWERWHKSLKHDEIKSIGDAIEQLMYEAIEFGGDMGPNGNTYNGIDEGDVLTAGFINEWVARFESTLGRDRYSYGQWREISNAVGDAMEYAHDRAIEHPDAADPLWNLDEYVNRILKVAFEGEATLGRGTCRNVSKWVNVFECSECGFDYDFVTDPYQGPRYCPNCGRRIEAVDE